MFIFVPVREKWIPDQICVRCQERGCCQLSGALVWNNILWLQRSRGASWAGESSCSHHSGWPDVVSHTHDISQPVPRLECGMKIVPTLLFIQNIDWYIEGKQFSPCSFPSHPLSSLCQCNSVRKTGAQIYSHTDLFMPLLSGKCLNLVWITISRS